MDELNLDESLSEFGSIIYIKIKNTMTPLKLIGQRTKKSITLIRKLFSLERISEGLNFDELSNDEG